LELQPMQTPKMKAAASKRANAMRVRDGDIGEAPEIFSRRVREMGSL
jgi:hypothetical protein